MPIDWVPISEGLPELDADNCCMEEEDYGRYSNVVLVCEDGEPEALRGCYDGKRSSWHNADTGADLLDVTHWQPLPELPNANRPAQAPAKERVWPEQEAGPEDTHDLCRHCGCAKTIQTQLATCPVRSGGLRHEWGPNRPRIWPTPVAVFSDGPLPPEPAIDFAKLTKIANALEWNLPDEFVRSMARRLLYLEERVEAAGDGLTREYLVTVAVDHLDYFKQLEAALDELSDFGIRAAWTACAERKL